MRNRWTLAVFLLLSLGSWPSLAHACTADFGGNCSWAGGSANANCVFDAGRMSPINPVGTSCPGSSVASYSWDYGDGSSPGTGSFVSHAYVGPASWGAVTVQLTVTCADSCIAVIQRNVCFTIGGGGCIEMNKGWN
jgi:hypothetical protein